ncbi:MAG: hypothetical protein HQL46_15530 [Gammaproteobacteria bacterium]|nr:hypothetical protein [Gammaproteobacteria bacterium]
MILPPKIVHRKGEDKFPTKNPIAESIEVDTYAGKVHIEWDQDAAVTPIAQLPFLFNF